MPGSAQNCWEYKRCGREPGGAMEAEAGPCPAAVDRSCDGLNGGVNGGRICWVVSGTLCDGEIHGDFSQKQCRCRECDFFRRVRAEERTWTFLMVESGKAYEPCG